MNNTDIPLEQEAHDVVDSIEFGMKDYSQLWGNLSFDATDKDRKNNLIRMTNKAIRRGEFCIIVTPEYKLAVVIYDDEQKCYRIAAHLVGFDKSLPTNIVWKKFQLINYFNDWKHNKNGSYKSVRGMKARYIDIADKEVIALIDDENKILEMENIYCKKGDCKK